MALRSGVEAYLKVASVNPRDVRDLLDTNVLSETRRIAPALNVRSWTRAVTPATRNTKEFASLGVSLVDP